MCCTTPSFAYLVCLRKVTDYFTVSDWAQVDPLDYLNPFMEVIRSPETSGPVTGVALTAVARFLDAYIIGHLLQPQIPQSEVQPSRCSMCMPICCARASQATTNSRLYTGQ